MALSRKMGMRVSLAARYAGAGYFGGDPAPTPNPDDLDGIARILNVPSRIKVLVFERSTMQCIRGTLSAADGSWRIEYLDENTFFTVIGMDGAGTVNADIQDWVKPAPM